MPLSIQPELKYLLKEVVQFLSELRDPAVSIRASTLKERIETLCFDKSELSVEEETYDEVCGEEKDDSVAELRSPSGSSTLNVPKGSVKRKPTSGAWNSEEQLIAEVPVSAFTNPTKRGYLEKRRPEGNVVGKLLSLYQKRYCVIDDGVFYYFESEKAKKQSGAFHLKEYEARPAEHLVKNMAKKEGSFEMVAPGHRSFQFIAKDFEELKEWIQAVDEHTEHKHPDVSTLVNPVESLSKGNASGSDSGSINTHGPPDVIEDEAYVDSDVQPPGKKGVVSPLDLKKRRPLPTPAEEETYDQAEVDKEELYDEGAIDKPQEETYDEAVAESPKKPAIEEETYDEATAEPPLPPGRGRPLPPPIDEEIYDEAEAEPPVPSKPLPKIPPTGRRNMPVPPVPEESSHRPLPAPPAQKTINAVSDDYENMFYGLWDCESSISHELSFMSGDIIHVVDREHDNAGWWTGVLNGKVGLVPKGFLTAAYAAA